MNDEMVEGQHREKAQKLGEILMYYKELSDKREKLKEDLNKVIDTLKTIAWEISNPSTIVISIDGYELECEKLIITRGGTSGKEGISKELEYPNHRSVYLLIDGINSLEKEMERIYLEMEAMGYANLAVRGWRG